MKVNPDGKDIFPCPRALVIFGGCEGFESGGCRGKHTICICFSKKLFSFIWKASSSYVLRLTDEYSILLLLHVTPSFWVRQDIYRPLYPRELRLAKTLCIIHNDRHSISIPVSWLAMWDNPLSPTNSKVHIAPLCPHTGPSLWTWIWGKANTSTIKFLRM